jgi:hypothetical protein
MGNILNIAKKTATAMTGAKKKIHSIKWLLPVTVKMQI